MKIDNSKSRTLVLVQHDHRQPADSTARLITAAHCFGQPVDLVVIGNDCHEVARKASRYKGVSHVLLIADQEELYHQLAEDMVYCLWPLLQAEHSVFLMASTADGRELVPLLASSLDVSPLTDVIQILAPNRFVRPVHAGVLFMEVKLYSDRKLMTLRPSGFEPVDQHPEGETGAELVICDPVALAIPTTVVGEPFLPALSLEEADIIIGIGRGAQGEDDHVHIIKLLKVLKAALGGSRIAVELGMIDNSEQIGQTGKSIAPKLYIALGISGAVQHLAGIRDAQVIVAINKDPDAPIFKVADYGLVGDLRDKLPELLKALAL